MRAPSGTPFLPSTTKVGPVAGHLILPPRISFVKEIHTNHDICLTVVSGASVQLWSTSEQPPCYVNDAEDPATIGILDYYLQRIIRSLHVLKPHSERLLQRMNMTYCDSLSAAEQVTASFIDLSAIDADTDSQAFLHDFCFDTTSFLETMRTHYEMLNELAYYLEKLRETSIDDTSEGQLTMFQEDVYECMCSIKSTLRSRHQDPLTTVPYGELSVIFEQYRKRRPIIRCVQQTSEFVTVLDSKRIIDYLEKVYTFEISASKCQ